MSWKGYYFFICVRVVAISDITNISNYWLTNKSKNVVLHITARGAKLFAGSPNCGVISHIRSVKNPLNVLNKCWLERWRNHCWVQVISGRICSLTLKQWGVKLALADSSMRISSSFSKLKSLWILITTLHNFALKDPVVPWTKPSFYCLLSVF